MTDNNKIVKNIFYYLEKHLFGADSDAGDELLTKGQFGVMMTPGQFVSPNWQETTGSTDMYNQWSLLNDALDTSFTYRPLITTISGVLGQYDQALNNVALRHRPLTQAEKDELDQINSEILQKQPAYELYQSRYFDKELAYQFEASKQHPNQARLAQLLQEMNNAYNNWETLGLKSYYENDLVGQAWQIQAGNPDGQWLQLRNQYRNATKIAPQGQYQTTLLSPPISTWAAAGWATFSRTVTDAETHQYSHSTAWSGGMGASWGLFSGVSVDASGHKTVTHATSDVTSIDVTFDYLRCRIIRPWLDPNLFACKDWTWIQPKTFAYLSDGGNLSANPPVRPIGALPFLPIFVVAVRNVIIRANFSHNDQQTMDESISGNVSAGFGFFSVRGSYSEATHTVDIKATFDGTELRIPNPQIVGYMGILLPKSPNPDKNLPYWPSTAVFPDHMSAEDASAMEEARAADRRLSSIRRAYFIAEQELSSRHSHEKDKLLSDIAASLAPQSA